MCANLVQRNRCHIALLVIVLVGFGLAVSSFTGLFITYSKSHVLQSLFEEHEMYRTIRAMEVASVDVDDPRGWMYLVETSSDEYLVEARYQHHSKIFVRLPLFRVDVDGGVPEILVAKEYKFSRLELIKLFGEFMDSVNEAILKTPQKVQGNGRVVAHTVAK
ncbi:MAG: hypothetical protein C9356_20270 [Oleiphilus sp.]|nr:MAG: hypothetical protein C9356_20270 [Oleiphilus sp.]